MNLSWFDIVLYLVSGCWLGMWCWFWMSILSILIIFSYWLVCVTLEVEFSISIPFIGLFYINVWIIDYLSCTLGVRAWLGNHVVGRYCLLTIWVPFNLIDVWCSLMELYYHHSYSYLRDFYLVELYDVLIIDIKVNLFISDSTLSQMVTFLYY